MHSDLRNQFKVEPLNIWPRMTVNDLVTEMGKSGAFMAGMLSKAVDTYERMIRDNAYVFLSLSGALIPAGMSRVLIELVNRKLVNCIVTTGANLVHDVMMAYGGTFFKGSPLLKDDLLLEKKIDRIYDVLVSEDEFVSKFDEPLLELYDDISIKRKGEVLSISELINEVAQRIPDKPESLLKSCYKQGVKIFVPTIHDSVFGLQAAIFNRKNPGRLTVDVFKDLQDIWTIREKASKSGAIILGGGVPKNFVFQSFYFSDKKLDYVVQVTLDRPETGGLSGAPPDEAVSWGKIRPDASKVVVVGEVTMVLPMMASALIERLEK
ncbi:MAG: deoxyhypusine synthase family protein [Nitrososphaerales archaeon]